MSALHQSKPRARSASAVYKRPAKLGAAPGDAGPLAYRFAVLRRVFSEADEELEAAYDMAEPDSAAEVLLDHVAHSLLVDVMGPGLYIRGGAQPPSIGVLANAHTSLVTVLAALEGVMALSVGSPNFAKLAEAFQSLDWARDECEELSGFPLLRSSGGRIESVTSPTKTIQQ